MFTQNYEKNRVNYSGAPVFRHEIGVFFPVEVKKIAVTQGVIRFFLQKQGEKVVNPDIYRRGTFQDKNSGYLSSYKTEK